jgi:NaMN:DMB phosphoribosyltransferase
MELPMAEPTSSTVAVATLATQAAAVPFLAVFGISLGLRADVLLAGFCGSVAAMALLNTVPSTGDTWRALLRDSFQRVMVAVGSALFAGYAAPLLALVQGLPPALLLSVAFVAGAGAQRLLAVLITRARLRTAQDQEGATP